MTNTPAGWYPNGDQWETYWDGAQWTDQHRPRQAAAEVDAVPAEELADADLHVGDGAGAPLLDFVSHIAGKNARVFVWPDRIEWDRKGRLSTGAKAGLAVMTVGLSYAKTGFTRNQSTEVIPMRSVTSVTVKRGKGFQSILQVITAGNTIDMRVAHKEAEQVRSTIAQLISGTHASQQTSQPAAAPVAAATPSAPQQDIAGQLHQLGSLRDAGVLTEEEFAAKKAELLARL